MSHQPTAEPSSASAPQPGERLGAAERAAHPLAAWAWGVLRDRGVGDQMLVLNACDRRLGRPDMSEKQERAHYAVSLFVDEVGHVPHATEWDEWRKSSPESELLPSATFIRNAFGGWPGLRASFETQPEVDVLSARLTSKGPAFTEEELLAVLRAWASEQDGPLGWDDLQAWLRDGGPARAGIERAPTQVQTFTRGRSFAAMLAAAGLGHRSVAAGRPARPTRAAPAELREALLEELRAWAAGRPGVLYQADFITHLTHLDAGHDLHGLPKPLDAARRMLGVWNQALASAGLAARSAVTRGGGTRSTRPDVDGVRPRVETNDWETLGRWVREAAASNSGAAMSYPQYDQWRRRRLEDAVRAGMPPEPIPSSGKLKRLASGSWYTVKVLAGVPGANEFAETGRSYAETDVAAAVRAAAAQVMPEGSAARTDLRAGQYIQWRAAEMAESRAAGRELHIPSVDNVRLKLGGPTRSWAVALRAALANRGVENAA